jgi:hypothetical protein
LIPYSRINTNYGVQKCSIRGKRRSTKRRDVRSQQGKLGRKPTRKPEKPKEEPGKGRSEKVPKTLLARGKRSPKLVTPPPLQ